MIQRKIWRTLAVTAFVTGTLAVAVPADAAPATSCDTSSDGMSAVRSISLPVNADWLNTSPTYDFQDLSPVANGFDRVGYCLELRTGAGVTSWVWTSFVPQSADPALLGLPTLAGQVFRGSVSDLTVAGNVAGVESGTGRFGYVEMWPNQYQAKAARQVPGGSDATFDADDSPTVSTTGYGSFQVSDRTTAKPILSVNRFTDPGSTALDIGIGARQTSHPDWTFAGNAGSYTSRVLTVFARPASVTLTSAPLPGQLFPRSTATNKATVPVSGTTRSAAITSVELEVWRAGVLISTLRQQTPAAGAAFAFNPTINAELVSYDLKLFAVSQIGRRMVRIYPDLVAGDAYLVNGQSNAEARQFVDSSAADETPWIRTFGTPSDNTALSTADSVWHRGVGDTFQQSGSIGQWGLHLAKRIVDTYRVPVAIMLGAHGGRPISFFQRNDSTPMDATTNYGRLLRRVTAAGLREHIRAILFYQGESDLNNAAVHISGFTALFADWRSDYGAASKVYTHQVRNSGCNSSGLQLREAQRQLQFSFDLTVLSTMGTAQNPDNCHYPYVDGYQALGDHNFAVLAKDLYGGQTAGVDAPDPVASTINAAGTQITIQLRNTSDPIAVAAGSERYFNVEGATITITRVSAATGGRLLLDLSPPAASAISVTYSVMEPNPPAITNATGTGMHVFDRLPILVPGSQYVITNVASGKAVDVPASSTTPGTRIIQWTPHAGANQQWIPTLMADGTYTFKNVASGLCLDVSGNSHQTGAAIIQWTCHGNPNQRWWITSAIGGGFTLTSASSRMAVTVNGTSNDDPLSQASDTDAGGQRWQLIRK